MPGRSMSSTYTGSPATLAGMSSRGTGWPTMAYSAAGLGDHGGDLLVEALAGHQFPIGDFGAGLRGRRLCRLRHAGGPSARLVARRLGRRECGGLRLRPGARPPLTWVDMLPCGEAFVRREQRSARITCMRCMETSNSSAAICAITVWMPWPISTLPVKTVTVPPGSMRIQRSRSGVRRRLEKKIPGSRLHLLGGLLGALAGQATDEADDARVGPAAARWRARPRPMSSSLGCGFCLSRAMAAMIMPGLQ